MKLFTLTLLGLFVLSGTALAGDDPDCGKFVASRRGKTASCSQIKDDAARAKCEKKAAEADADPAGELAK